MNEALSNLLGPCRVFSAVPFVLPPPPTSSFLTLSLAFVSCPVPSWGFSLPYVGRGGKDVTIDCKDVTIQTRAWHVGFSLFLSNQASEELPVRWIGGETAATPQILHDGYRTTVREKAD
jgi:hypothetical protein